MGKRTLGEFSHIPGRSVNGKTSLEDNLAASGRAATHQPHPPHVPLQVSSHTNAERVRWGDRAAALFATSENANNLKFPSVGDTTGETKNVICLCEKKNKKYYMAIKKEELHLSLIPWMDSKIHVEWHKCRTIMVTTNASSVLYVPTLF